MENTKTENTSSKKYRKLGFCCYPSQRMWIFLFSISKDFFFHFQNFVLYISFYFYHPKNRYFLWNFFKNRVSFLCIIFIYFLYFAFFLFVGNHIFCNLIKIFCILAKILMAVTPGLHVAGVMFREGLSNCYCILI